MRVRPGVSPSFNQTELWELHVQGMAAQSANYTVFI